MDALMFVAILLPVAAVMWCLSRPAVDDHEPPILNVQNDEDDLGPIVGVWTPLDPVTPEQVVEDRPHLVVTEHAWNVVVPSGRSWNYRELPRRIADMRAGRFG